MSLNEQTQRCEGDASAETQTTLQNNPFMPPKSGSCPINQLPPELLSHIFDIGAATCDDDEEDEEETIAQRWNEFGDDGLPLEQPDTDDEDDEDGSSIATLSDASDSWPLFQVLVSHVCRHWRDVALSTPSLWTQISIICTERPPFERVSTLLERSKGLPVDIHIDCEPPEDALIPDEEPPKSFSEDDFKALLAILIPHVPRWGSIWIDVFSYEHTYTFLSAVSDPSVPAAQQLESLLLYHHDESDEYSTPPKPYSSNHFVLFGGSAPRLKNVVLWGVHVDWDQSLIASAPNLMELELAYHTEDARPSWAAFNTILRGAPDLRVLRLTASGPSGTPSQWSIEPDAVQLSENINGMIELRKLIDLALAFHPPHYAVALIRKLYTPVLKSLTLDFDNEDYTDLVTQLVGPATAPTHFRREQPRSLLSGLENIKICGLPCSSASAKQLYGELKNVKSLTLSMSYLDPAFLQLLEPPVHGDILLPALKSLSTSGAIGYSIRLLVEKRKEAGVPLKAVYVEESSEIEDEDVEWLKENVEIFDFYEGSDDELEDVEDVIDEEEDEWTDED